MRGWKRLTWGLLGAATITGCASTMPRELLDARYAYQRASSGPAAQYSPDALAEARDALNEANRAYERERDSEHTRTLAYVALRKAQIAESRARTIVAEQERQQAEQQLAMSQASESLRTRQELDKARAELAEAQRLRAEAEQRQAQLAQQQQEAARQQELAAQQQAEQQRLEQARREEQERQARLDEAQARMDQLNAQLEQERQARLEAEQRAARAEAEARAQAQVASELRSIRQVEVKEEQRGLVLTLSGSVLFRSGSVDLLPTARRRLDEVAEALKKTQNPLVIEGHTDSQGPEELNEDLSYQRAESVRDYLVERGLDSSRIRIDGRGESQPVASNKTAEGRANNRRVEIVLERGVGGAGQSESQPSPTP
ncbi:OmpA family protein [Archangium minus]|uniref:OmpA family protein n=1 Tax=Archangium minus TaxID=83450 RepID=A0ABY9X5X9_9BACT|nr:OmpA family protein [Archangium minus]